jgi:2-iminobutanoate/2-iminopropanoate deaminase
VTIIRTPGQVPALPGAVRAGAFVCTSGVVSPEVLSGADVPFDRQAEGAMRVLLSALADAGAGPEHVVRLEAFLADRGDFAAWNAVFAGVWPVPGPARTTLVSGFAAPGVRIELQAIAIVETDQAP